MRRALYGLSLLLLPAMALAAVPEVKDLAAHRTGNMAEFQQVIDSKCTICHTRERVDVAIRKRADIEKLEQEMVDRGAVLSERDKSVLGTFWGNPLKRRAR